MCVRVYVCTCEASQRVCDVTQKMILPETIQPFGAVLVCEVSISYICMCLCVYVYMCVCVYVYMQDSDKFPEGDIINEGKNDSC